MALVLDTTALCDYCSIDERSSRALDSLLRDNDCCLAPICAAEALYLIEKYDGKQRADALYYMLDIGQELHVADDADIRVVADAAEMRKSYGVNLQVAMTVAIARKMDVSIVISEPRNSNAADDYRILESNGMCSVIRL